MKKLIFISVIYICYSFGCFVKAQAGTDKSIKDAKSTATSAVLKKYQKFSDNDSVLWIYGGDASLGFNATQLTNWAAGGEDQIGINSVVNLYANYKKGKRTFENYGTFAYGIMKRGEGKAVKNDDKINISSKAGHQMTSKWYYTAAFLAKTQFSPGYKYSGKDTIRVSDFLAPIYLYLSIGFDYRPSNKFSSVFSPLMGKATFARSDDVEVLSNAGLVETVKDESGNDVKVTRKSRYEFGGGMLFNLNGNLLKNKVSYSSQLELFSNYAKNPQNVDITWALQAKILIYKNISADLRLDIKYDDDQKTIDEETKAQRGAKVQVKNYIGVGLFYEF